MIIKFRVNPKILYGSMICTGIAGILLAILFKAEAVNDKYIIFMPLVLIALFVESFLYAFIKKEVGIGGKAYTKEFNPVIYYSHIVFCVVMVAIFIYHFVKDFSK
jgi:drug/metabolite transporter (DMT)-like permease